MSSTQTAFHLKTKTSRALDRAAAVVGWTPEELINCAVLGVAEHIRQVKNLMVPMRLLTPEQIPVLISGRMREELMTTAKQTGSSHTWVARLLIDYGLKRLREGRLKIVHPGEEDVSAASLDEPAVPPVVHRSPLRRKLRKGSGVGA